MKRRFVRKSKKPEKPKQLFGGRKVIEFPYRKSQMPSNQFAWYKSHNGYSMYVRKNYEEWLEPRQWQYALNVSAGEVKKNPKLSMLVKFLGGTQREGKVVSVITANKKIYS